MKRITLLLAIFFTFQFGFAQEEVAIEQIIDQPINALVINPGWNVQLRIPNPRKEPLLSWKAR